jgi:hypothetical protein
MIERHGPLHSKSKEAWISLVHRLDEYLIAEFRRADVATRRGAAWKYQVRLKVIGRVVQYLLP